MEVCDNFLRTLPERKHTSGFLECMARSEVGPTAYKVGNDAECRIDLLHY